MDGININQELKIGLLHNMNEIEKLAKHYKVDKQIISDVLDVWAFIESNRDPEIISPNKVDRGTYQLGNNSEGGGFQRLKNGYLKIPEEVTPEWMGIAYEDAKDNDNTINAEEYSKEKQDFIMAAYLLGNNNTLDFLKQLQTEDNASTKLDMIVNTWLDEHWQGWQKKKNPETVRANKKTEVLKRVRDDYKKDPNWISMSDGLNYNFNMNDYA